MPYKDPEKRRECARMWARNNPEKCHRWNRNHKEEFNAINRAYYWRTRDKQLERSKRYHASHLEHRHMIMNRWAQNNKERRASNEAKRRTAKVKSGGSYSVKEWYLLKKFYKNRCVCCGRTEDQLVHQRLMLVPDHVIPVSKGGNSSIYNLQPLCHSLKKGSTGGCNNSKSNKNIDYRVNKEKLFGCLAKSLFLKTNKYASVNR